MCRMTGMFPIYNFNGNAAQMLTDRQRRHVFALLMLYAVTDGDQSDGAGVSDGECVRKSALPFNTEWSLDWVDNLDPTRPWIGHVRKASPLTDRGTFAAHPYLFSNQWYDPENDNNRIERPFSAMHNGFVDGFEKVVRWPIDVEPNTARQVNTDSWRAFARLEQRLRGMPITQAELEHWASEFYETSQFSFMFLQGRTLHILRGDRTLFVMQVGNHVLVHTSDHKLGMLRSFLSRFHEYDDRMFSPVYGIDPYVYLCIPDNHRFTGVDVGRRPLANVLNANKFRYAPRAHPRYLFQEWRGTQYTWSDDPQHPRPADTDDSTVKG